MNTQIGIKEESLAEVAQTLNHILADEYILYTQTRKAHWNVEGPDFHAMHIFFETQYQEIDQLIDDIAERIRTLGHFAVASLREFVALAHLTEESRDSNSGQGHIKELLISHESIIMELRKFIDRFQHPLNDYGTSDFITGLMKVHEKMAWMLRAHLN